MSPDRRALDRAISGGHGLRGRLGGVRRADARSPHWWCSHMDMDVSSPRYPAVVTLMAAYGVLVVLMQGDEHWYRTLTDLVQF